MARSPHADATANTTPWVYWQANVLEIVAAEMPGCELPGDWLAKMPLWFRTGETVEQAATSLIDVIKIRRRPLVDLHDALRTALVASARGTK